jgi:hypothetical protein
MERLYNALPGCQMSASETEFVIHPFIDLNTSIAQVARADFARVFACDRQRP